MLTLRTSIGLTQAGLADLLHISRHAVAEWEAGSSYPRAERLKEFLTLCVQQQAFPAGREEEEIRALWRAAHQKVLFDEPWLAALLDRPRPALPLLPAVPLDAPSPGELLAPQPTPGPRLDWGEALDVPSIYGREQELATLARWVVQERCRMVSVLGMGGIGKSALVEHEVRGSSQERAHLVEAYSGNPLALNIVAETIADLFGGAIDPFLAGGTVIFGGITELLEEQWARLSPLEQTVLCWLAILREPVTLDELFAVLVSLQSRVQVLEAVDSLRRRSLIERGQRAGSFTLQSVVLEYVTTKLVTAASEAIQQGRLERLREHGLAQAQAKEYVRQTQERLLLAPVLARLQSVHQERVELEGWLRAVLETLRGRAEEAQGYGPANLVALLCLLRGDLRGLDLSQLALRGVYLQGVELQDATLSGALMRECVFTETFDAITAVAISRSGQYWAAASQRGEVQVWREAGQTLHLAWQAHTDMVTSIAFSPDERTLASGSVDNSVKLWDVASGAALWTGWHTKGTTCLAFAPDGSLLASGGSEATVRLWDAKLGTPLQELLHPGVVFSLAWSPDGRLLASGDVAG